MFSESKTITYSELKIDKELGRGGFGVVYQGTWRHNDVAVKQLLMDKISAESAKEFETESQVMSQLRSPNIVQFYGFCMSPTYCIVMEYMPNGSLFGVLHGQKPLEWDVRIRIATDVAKGLAFLHQESILHRDIKSLNVLLDEHYKAKLTDFGLSKVKAETKSHSMATKSKNDSVGTIAWMAPELFEGRKVVYTLKSDIYSLGVTFWELASRKIPFSEAHNPSLIPVWVQKGDREDIPSDCPTKLAALIQECWDNAPDKRPDANTIVSRLKDSNKPIAFSASALSNSRAQYRDNFDSTLVSSPHYQDNFGSEMGSSKPLTFSPVAPKPIAQSIVILEPAQSLNPFANTNPFFDQNSFARSPVAARAAVPIPQMEQLAIAKPAPRVNTSDLSTFLKLIAEGEQKEAEAMLKANKDLALVPGDVTDLSKRTFKGITAFQYAVWALDWHMWTMMRKYLPDDKAREQCEAMETGSWVSQYGKSASWQNLIDAMKEYIDLCNRSKWSEAGTQWQKQVGGAQRLLPVHVINEYCHPTRPFEPCPDFTSAAPLPRTRQIDQGDWFTTTHTYYSRALGNTSGKLGDTFGVLRYNFSNAGASPAALGPGVRFGYGDDDRKACLALLSTRVQQRDDLLTELKPGNRQQLKDDRNNLGEWPNSYPQPNTDLSTLSPISGDSFSSEVSPAWAADFSKQTWVNFDSEASSSRPVTFSSAVPKPIAQSIDALDILDTLFGQTPFTRPLVAPVAVPTSPLAQLAIANPTPRVNPVDLSKALKLVAEGEQNEAEAMLKANKNLALVFLEM